MVVFFVCQLFVKMFGLFGDHPQGEEAGEQHVLTRGRKLLQTSQTAGSNQDCYMSKSPTKYLDKQ